MKNYIIFNIMLLFMALVSSLTIKCNWIHVILYTIYMYFFFSQRVGGLSQISVVCEKK